MRFKFSIGAPVILKRCIHTDKATNVEPAWSVWMGRVSVVLKVETNVLCLCSSNNFHKNMKTIMSPQVNRPQSMYFGELDDGDCGVLSGISLIIDCTT